MEEWSRGQESVFCSSSSFKVYSLRKHPHRRKPFVCKQFDTFAGEGPLFYRLVPIRLTTAANHVGYLAGVSICVYPALCLPPFLVYTGLEFQPPHQPLHGTHFLPLFFPVWNLLLLLLTSPLLFFFFFLFLKHSITGHHELCGTPRISTGFLLWSHQLSLMTRESSFEFTLSDCSFYHYT